MSELQRKWSEMSESEDMSEDVSTEENELETSEENEGTLEEHDSSGNTIKPRSRLIRKYEDGEKEVDTEKFKEKMRSFKVRARNVILTVQKEGEKNLNNLIKYMKHFKAFNYILITKHDGPSVEHFHIYVQFNQPRTIDSRYCYGAHLEESFGSAKSCIKYLKCEDKKHKAANVNYEMIYEEGKPKLKGGRIKDIENMDEKEIKKLPAMMYNIAKKIKNDKMTKDAVDEWLKVKDIKVEWHYGLAGTGKTYYAKMIGREYRKQKKDVGVISFDKNGFIHYIGNLEQCELLIINEFRDSNMNYKDFLEILTNEHQYNIKGMSLYPLNINRIIITSQQRPDEIYKNVKEDKNQIFRRINELMKHEKDEHGFKAYATDLRKYYRDDNDVINLDLE